MPVRALPTKGDGPAIPGSLVIDLGTESVTDATLGVFEDLVFAEDFERR